MIIKLKYRIIFIILVALVIVGIFGYSTLESYILKTTHKTKYKEIVGEYATEYDVDEYFIFAVIKTESNFNKDAVSSVGARGLMQMMNETFVWVKTKVKDENTVYDDMFEPEQNIRYGTYLIDYLVEEFGDYETALAAYHAGRGAVNKWLADSRYSDDGKTLKKIPISDTEHYVHKVMKTFETYKKIYKE